uniref:Uncharacterized protein n=1 Tax=Ananas comosus var. bracteatus TaxID=296719 RepID=A0A6V7PH81_ANACO|nr:unnamed protein product [Ananas comosus var. bracteatus]
MRHIGLSLSRHHLLYTKLVRTASWVLKSRTSLDPEVAETFWWVVDSVPTYGSSPENCGLKPCTKAQNDWTLVSSRVACSRACTGTRLVLYRYKVDGCTGTAIGLVPVQSRRPRNPSLGFAFSWALYRYKSPCTGSLPTSWHSGDSHRDSYLPCGIGRRSGLPWARLIPRVGMMTTTGH